MLLRTVRMPKLALHAFHPFILNDDRAWGKMSDTGNEDNILQELAGASNLKDLIGSDVELQIWSTEGSLPRE